MMMAAPADKRLWLSVASIPAVMLLGLVVAGSLTDSKTVIYAMALPIGVFSLVVANRIAPLKGKTRA